MYDDGIENGFEEAHQKGLSRGFDLGWSYKGRFDRTIIQDRIRHLEEELESHLKEKPKDGYIHPNPDIKNNICRVRTLKDLLTELQQHDSNREFIT
tara:strand:- start:153 stop:440 length:288 start_codon:yes stop_codon:yes gene_type:complete